MGAKTWSFDDARNRAALRTAADRDAFQTVDDLLQDLPKSKIESRVTDLVRHLGSDVRKRRMVEYLEVRYGTRFSPANDGN